MEHHEKERFWELLMYGYMISIGLEYQNYMSRGLVLYLCASLVFLVVMLNLLIAIISDTFDQVMLNQYATSRKEHCKMMLEIESLLMFNVTRKVFKPNRQYLHICKYYKKVAGEGPEWEGKLKQI